jgi:hypothetical protein
VCLLNDTQPSRYCGVRGWLRTHRTFFRPYSHQVSVCCLRTSFNNAALLDKSLIRSTWQQQTHPSVLSYCLGKTTSSKRNALVQSPRSNGSRHNIVRLIYTAKGY